VPLAGEMKWSRFKSEMRVLEKVLLRWTRVSQPVYGTIMNYRIGIRTQMPKWCLIQIKDADSVSKAGQLIGRKVILKYEKNEFIGRIMGLHGKKGFVKAKFRKGALGQAKEQESNYSARAR